MNDRSGILTPSRVATASGTPRPRSRARLRAIGVVRDAFKDVVAGLVSSIVLIANIVSFGALMFPGELAHGVPIAIWAMLIGSCIAGTWIALRTSLPPLATGIDSPTGAVLVLLSATTGPSVFAATQSAAVAIQTVMLVFTAATVVAGALLFCIGAFRLGSYCRFIPYFVVGGFLAATGWLLMIGGVRTATGISLSLTSVTPAWTTTSNAQLVSALAALLVLLAVRRWSRWALAMPVTLLAMWLIAALALRELGLSGPEHGWYLPALGALTPWVPLEAVRTTRLTWPIVIEMLPQFIAVAIVALISLVTKVSSIEVMRKTSGDLDREFRANGLGNVVAAPFGGIASGLQTGTSVLLKQAGAATRMSGVAAALVLGVVAVAHFDLPGLIPVPIIAGLVFYLGYTFFVEALARPLAQRAWQELLLAIAIMLVCVRYGFVVGVLVGVVAACVRFALDYARLGAVRRYATRALFASNVDRSVQESAYLRDHGAAIRLYWLSGYIFFGSSESLFERIRNDIESARRGTVRYVVLDFAMVSGVDASAIMSLTKLRNLCDWQATTIVYCSLSPVNRAAFARAGFFGGRSRHQVFADLNTGLAWCEDRLIADGGVEPERDLPAFEAWLQHQLGTNVAAGDLMRYLERRHVDASQTIYRQGEPADSIDLVAAGDLAVDVEGDDGRVRLRRITTHTMLGEMGFVRNTARVATVSAEGPATIFTLTRARMERMRQERPELAHAFDDFIMRTLADRIETANRAATALTR
jgi:SulP family sulfate permease